MNMRTAVKEFPFKNNMSQSNTTDIAELILEKRDSVTLLKVNTDVMSDAGINDGDVVAVDRSLPYDNSSIIVAVIDDEMVIRKLEAGGGKEFLVTPGRKLAPLEVTGRLNVWGVVMYVIRKV
jgi:DNA polymerase V